MPNFIKKTDKIHEVGIYENSGVTRIDRFIQPSNEKNSNTTFETSRGEFEKNTIPDNAAYFTTGDDNPLIKGLLSLDRAALVISGKHACSSFAFTDGLLCSTPYHIKNATLTEANDIVLKNLGMREPVLYGLPLGRPFAIKFNALSIRITKDVKLGNRVYETYIEDVIMIGTEAIKEWIYHGN